MAVRSLRTASRCSGRHRPERRAMCRRCAELSVALNASGCIKDAGVSGDLLHPGSAAGSLPVGPRRAARLLQRPMVQSVRCRRTKGTRRLALRGSEPGTWRRCPIAVRHPGSLPSEASTAGSAALVVAPNRPSSVSGRWWAAAVAMVCRTGSPPPGRSELRRVPDGKRRRCIRRLDGPHVDVLGRGPARARRP